MILKFAGSIHSILRHNTIKLVTSFPDSAKKT